MLKRHRVGVILAVIAVVFAVTVGYFQWQGEGAIEYVMAAPHFLLYGLPSEKYQAQLYKLQDAVQPLLPKGEDIRDHIAVYGEGGEAGFLTIPTRLQIYNVSDPADQERIIARVREKVTGDRMIPVRVEFHQETALPSGQKAGGPDTITRTLIVR